MDPRFEGLPSLNKYPDLLTSEDLVSIGFYPSADAAYLARLKGHSPDFVKIGKKVLYPKKSVIAFLEKHFKKGDSTREERLEETQHN